jgi:hypothetical protein
MSTQTHSLSFASPKLSSIAAGGRVYFVGVAGTTFMGGFAFTLPLSRVFMGVMRCVRGNGQWEDVSL